MKKAILKIILVPLVFFLTLNLYAKNSSMASAIPASKIIKDEFVSSEFSKDSIYKDVESVKIRVYPNPVQENFLYISLASDKEADYSVRVYNMIGRVVEQKTISKGQNSIDLSDYKEGIYFVDVLEDGKTIQSMKIIRE